MEVVRLRDVLAVESPDRAVIAKAQEIDATVAGCWWSKSVAYG
jgi:hypothetical protein